MVFALGLRPAAARADAAVNLLQIGPMAVARGFHYFTRIKQSRSEKIVHRVPSLVPRMAIGGGARAARSVAGTPSKNKQPSRPSNTTYNTTIFPAIEIAGRRNRAFFGDENHSFSGAALRLRNPVTQVLNPDRTIQLGT